MGCMCMYVYVCMYICVCIYVCVCILYACVYARMYVRMRVNVYAYCCVQVGVKTGPSVPTSCDPRVPAIFCAVNQSAHKCYSGPKHCGHQDTRSALLCHVSDHDTRIFLSVHLNPDPFCHAGLVPVDERYFHVVIAYLEPPGDKW